MTVITPIEDEASVSLARQRLRAQCAAHEIDPERIERAAIVVSELAHNQLRYARLGEILVDVHGRGDLGWVEVRAADAGPGFQDAVAAFRGVPRDGSGGLGIGLAGVRRLASEVDVETRYQGGVHLRARFLPPSTPSGPTYAIVGRPHPDERVSGDEGLVIREKNTIIAVLADGLGHGPEAMRAAHKACQAASEASGRTPAERLASCEAALRDTRGAAVAVAQLDLLTDEVSVAIAGNVRVGIYRQDSAQRFPYTPRVLGRGSRGSFQTTTLPRRGGILLLCTDGVSEREDPLTDRLGLVSWPLPLAWRLVMERNPARDDTMAIAIR
jgi:anti-sigma regulatory factor (Ser/Thr protein kinase)